MEIVRMIREDSEIQAMKFRIKELTGKNAPPFSYDEDGSISKYKTHLGRIIVFLENEERESEEKVHR